MIYLDHAATTPIFPEVLDVVLPWFQPDRVGNPSSIHTQGVKARKAVEKARHQVANMIGAEPSEIFFTSGGTESNNTWIRCLKNPRLMSEFILTTRVEHHSVLEAISHSSASCSCRRYPMLVDVRPDGTVDLDDLEHKVSTQQVTIDAVSIMWVNNELGTVNPIKEIGDICKKYDIPFHSDAVAAAGHVPIDVHKCGVDFLSLSGHKFGAPQGIGVLYINNSIRKRPLIAGGGQEHEMRGGTENVPGIVGIGRAAEIVTSQLTVNMQMWGYYRARFMTDLNKNMPGEFRINVDSDDSTSNIISLTVPGVNSESLLLLLDQQDIYISAGSACSAASSEPSHVLRGVGISDEDAACTVRISMGFDTTYTDIVRAAKSIADTVHRLKSMYP